MNNTIKTKEHRLTLDCYRGLTRATFTACLSARVELFIEENGYLVDECRQALLQACRQYNCKNVVFIFMPDHVHVILEGIDDSSDLWKTMVRFKQATGYLFSKKKLGVSWQKNFWDRIHRQDETLEQQIRYILNNPLRAGLVSDWDQYPFSGSLDYDIKSIITGKWLCAD